MVNLSIHWLTLTIWASYIDVINNFIAVFGNRFGDFVMMKYGTKGYPNLYVAGSGIRLGCGDELSYCTISIPGTACDLMGFQDLTDLIRVYKESYKIRASRIDVAADGLKVDPFEVYKAVINNDCVTPARRATATIILNEKGDTFYLGSRYSLRLLRVYNERGYTRVELQSNDERADWVLEQILSRGLNVIPAVINDYIVFTEMKEWSFDDIAVIEDYQVKGRSVYADMMPIMSWLVNQVAGALSLVEQVEGKEALRAIIEGGRFKIASNPKYKQILSSSEVM